MRRRASVACVAAYGVLSADRSCPDTNGSFSSGDDAPAVYSADAGEKAGNLSQSFLVRGWLIDINLGGPSLEWGERHTLKSQRHKHNQASGVTTDDISLFDAHGELPV